MGVVIGIAIIGVIVYFAIKAFNKKSGIVADTRDKPKQEENGGDSNRPD